MENKLNTSCSINLIVNRQRTKTDGTCRLYISITVEKDNPVKIKLPLFWPLEFYDSKTRTILPRHNDDKDFVEFIALIETEKAKYWRIVKKFYLQDKYFTVNDILKGVNEISIGSKLGEYITQRSRERLRKKQIKEHTRNNHLASARKLLKLEPDDIDIIRISESWLNNYLKNLLKTLEYGGAWSHIKTICAYVRDAKERGVTVNETFEHFNLEPCDSNPVWLEKEELDRLLQLYNEDSLDYEHKNCLRGFLFNCFTGLRISDLKRFNSSWIVGNEIVFEPVKGRITSQKPQIVHIPIIETARQFLSKLSNHKMIDEAEQTLNRRLKTIATGAGINKVITHHVARHTFGTLLAVAGLPVVVISNIMGHKKTSTTMVYIHIAENIRQTEMNKLQHLFANFLVEPKMSDYTKAPIVN